MYNLVWLSKELLLIKWLENATTDTVRKFVAELYSLLNQEEHSFYMIIDLRYGQIIDTQAFSRVRLLTQHQNWAGSAAFRTDPISNIEDTTFQIINKVEQDRNVVFNTPEEAIGFLESLKPGLTADINWGDVLQ